MTPGQVVLRTDADARQLRDRYTTIVRADQLAREVRAYDVGVLQRITDDSAGLPRWAWLPDYPAIGCEDIDTVSANLRANTGGRYG